MVPLLALALVAYLALALSRFDFDPLDGGTASVELGIVPAQDPRARTVDEEVVRAVEARSFNRELRLRLGRPSRTVEIGAFWADSCEVRQLDFERFAQWFRERIRSDPSLEVPPGTLASTASGHRVAGHLGSPVTGVNYAGARAYCHAAGGRLPWAEEWEAMAAGAEGRLYPWGNEFDEGFWPYQDAYRNSAQPCGSHPGAATPEGVHDLAGNALEWSRGSRAEAVLGPRPGVHGAPADRPRGRALYALNSSWIHLEPARRSLHLGFRCVYDRPPRRRLAWGGELPRAVRVEGGTYPLGLPPEVRLARMAVLLPPAQLRQSGSLLARGDKGGRTLRVGVCEASRRDYGRFLDDPLVRLGLFANEHEPRDTDYLPADWERQLSSPDLPVTGIDWWAADAFARWAGGRLPTVEEWQQLASGEEGRAYPWGNDYRPGAAVTGDLPDPGLRPCEAEGLADLTASGLRHLAGNVSEWTQSIVVDQANYAMWVQGGNWVLPGAETAQSTFGRFVPLSQRSSGIGIRVVYDG